MNARLKLITPPTVEPVTLEQALNQCHANAGIEDAWFTQTIKSAREFAEDYQWKAYISQTWQMTFDVLPPHVIYIPRAPLISVDSVDVYDVDNVKTEMDMDDFYVDSDTEPARMILNKGNEWPDVELREMSCVKIGFTAGYGTTATTVPEAVKDAILLYIAHAWNNRAGEYQFPRQFFDLLRPNRLYQ